MAVAWTKEQQKVISLRNRNILVAAAAGSGKTAVLVERIIRMITSKEHPVSVDRLLIVTFTEAAATEMRDRIRVAIEKMIEQEPENEYLRQQATLVYSAPITTIHSFCLSVIREHFHRIDLDPGFRIVEEGERILLVQEVLEEVIERNYQEGRERFLQFVDSYGGTKNDKNIEDIILKIYEFSRSYPDPDHWFKECEKAYDIRKEAPLEETLCYKRMMEEYHSSLESAKDLVESGLRICLDSDGPYMYEKVLEADLEVLENLLEQGSYQECRDALEKVKWSRLPSSKDDTVSEEKKDEVKAVRETIKQVVKGMKATYFEQSIEEVIEDLTICLPMLQEVIGLVQEFAESFEEKKRSRNLIDFGDMEQYALRILAESREGEMVPTIVAKEYQQQFVEIMIDEYQDSNLIQETILASVSRIWDNEPNLFMVGDVKQSIYRFRLSRPELFMGKYETYSEEDSQEQKIVLGKTFRSRSQVLHSVNFFFYQIMRRELGGVEYDAKSALYVGADYIDSVGNETEVILVAKSEAEEEDLFGESLSNQEREVVAIGTRIRELMKDQMVTDKETGKLRPIRYRDIVILSRSIRKFSEICQEYLPKMGIPVYAGSKQGYFETQEIGVVLDYLKILSNRQQDIPLATVLKSYFGKLQEEDLALIRGKFPDVPFWKAVFLYENEGEESRVREKLIVCREQMEEYRKKLPYTPLHEVIEEILVDTGYLDYVATLPAGEQREGNLRMLVEKTRAFEKTSYRGIFYFNRYIEQLKKYNIDEGEANLSSEEADVVRIMSIHKSKGLEFPVVIVAGMSKRFNKTDLTGNVIPHARLGIGMNAVNLEERTKTVSFVKQSIAREETLDMLGEELRILYVAMTRAKEKLILTGTMKDAWEAVERIEERQKDYPDKEINQLHLAGVNCYMDWILPALEQCTEEDEIVLRVADIEMTQMQEVEEAAGYRMTRDALEHWDLEAEYDQDVREYLENQFSYRYPYDSLEGKKLKYTVSELKKRAYLSEEAGELLCEEPVVVPLIPRFLQEQQEGLIGANRGSAYHRVMELLDFGKVPEKNQDRYIKESLDVMLKTGRISETMKNSIKGKDILSFLQANCSKRMIQADRKNRLWKEQPFVLGVPMEEVYPEMKGCKSEELVLIQGIIDVYFEEEDGLIVLDYKTDKVVSRKELVDRYQMQLRYYSKALEQITGKRVKERIIYSFTLGEEILIP